MNMDILSNLIIKDICSSAIMYNEANKGTLRKKREQWAVILKYEGETRYTSCGKTYISNAHNAVVLPKGSTYEWLCLKAGHFITIEFQCDVTCEGIFSFPLKNSEKALALFKETEYKITLGDSVRKIECIRDIYSIILTLINSSDKKYHPSDKKQKIVPVLNYIAKNYHQSITNEVLADITGLSTVYFRKLFTEVMEVSPIVYVHELRISKAKEMLRSDYGTITDIAYSLGYHNIYDFSRDFKKHTGMSPSIFVKRE